MKKTVLIIVLCSALSFSCGGGGDSFDFSSVYIAGWYFTGDGHSCCYWNGGKRTDIDGLNVHSILASDGTILITGNYEDALAGAENPALRLIDFYWIDGVRHGYDRALGRGVALINGEAVFVNSSVFTVREGKVYTAADSYPANSVVYYFADGVRHDVATCEASFQPRSITVDEDGKVYIAGEASGKPCYYAGGELFYLQGFDENESSFSVRKIMVSGGKAYVFTRNHSENGIVIYWVDGKKATVKLTGYDAGVQDCFVTKNGAVLMAGYYYRGNSSIPPNRTACYWVNGSRYDLNGGSASAIFVEE